MHVRSALHQNVATAHTRVRDAVFDIDRDVAGLYQNVDNPTRHHGLHFRPSGQLGPSYSPRAAGMPGRVHQGYADGSAAAPHPNFKPHPMQGWTPDFIPKLTGDAVQMKVISRISL